MTDPLNLRCPGCGDVVNDDDTIQRTVAGVVWHARCKDHYDHARRCGVGPLMSTATLHERLIDRCINYTITPQRFVLDIPVEALAGLSPDAHTRMLAMLNAWITEHKPVVVKGPTT